MICVRRMPHRRAVLSFLCFGLSQVHMRLMLPGCQEIHSVGALVIFIPGGYITRHIHGKNELRLLYERIVRTIWWFVDVFTGWENNIFIS